MIAKTALLLLLVTPVTAQTATDPTAGAPAAAKPEKKICRRIETTGSIMGKSVCHTKSEWAAIDQTNASDAAAFGNSRNVGGGSGSVR